MTDCIFCKIIKGDIPCTKVYEDDNVLAFLDVAPINKGHTLIIPKEHHKDFLEMPAEASAAVSAVAKKIAKAVLEATEAPAFNLHVNNGEVAGQAVPHFHIHIIPRFKGDGYHHWHGKPYEEGEETEIANKIKAGL